MGIVAHSELLSKFRDDVRFEHGALRLVFSRIPLHSLSTFESIYEKKHATLLNMLPSYMSCLAHLFTEQPLISLQEAQSLLEHTLKTTVISLRAGISLLAI